MFIHGKTNCVYYSVREKINYYKGVINGSIKASNKTKAKIRLKSLLKINNQSYDEPRLIVTDDKLFGNGISKPRLCVAYGEDDKGRIKAYTIENRTSKAIILDNNPNRQISSKFKYLDKSNVYELKYISSAKPLSAGTKKILKFINK